MQRFFDGLPPKHNHMHYRIGQQTELDHAYVILVVVLLATTRSRMNWLGEIDNVLVNVELWFVSTFANEGIVFRMVVFN